ncbi:hypothetical protein PoB_000040700 [Plakobranchus ocellatus]|uniref:Uncharacterized protein n=1 Tax=Plakobranchus ocellatus TaxID=259542 RepID=A0AAV3XUV2_9GAST|nr:hypothetical protein PoB_000040700 [Plakobranchus ocellatus]
MPKQNAGCQSSEHVLKQLKVHWSQLLMKPVSKGGREWCWEQTITDWQYHEIVIALQVPVKYKLNQEIKTAHTVHSDLEPQHITSIGQN